MSRSTTSTPSLFTKTMKLLQNFNEYDAERLGLLLGK
jgi:hypothetical protein